MIQLNAGDVFGLTPSDLASVEIDGFERVCSRNLTSARLYGEANKKEVRLENGRKFDPISQTLRETGGS